jgi:5-methyltetrahydropteroyltriglutamate--homocysteine methyltransferase
MPTTAPAPKLPLLPTMGIGSYASPGWFISGKKHMKEEFGPDDSEEMIDDAIRIAVADQVEAGLDVISDGEFRRQRFVFELFQHLSGLKRVTPGRKLGIPGYDMAPRFQIDEPVLAPKGLGTVDEFIRAKRIAQGRLVKIAIPGPLTFASFMRAGGKRPNHDVIEDLIVAVRAELEALAEAGATYVQLDEPGLPKRPFDMDPGPCIDIVNRTLKGLPFRRSVHVCFGNNAGRPMADRRFEPLLEAMLKLDCDELALEFANREMQGVELLAPLTQKFDVAAGVIDVKNFLPETPERVAERIEQCLQHAPVERLRITADCGFSALPRWLARQKMQAMVAGTAIVRRKRGLA